MKKIFKSIFWAELLLFHFEKSRFSFQKNGAYSYDVKTFFGLKFFLKNHSICMFNYRPLL